MGIVAGYGNTLGTVASVVQPKLLGWVLEATGASKESTGSGHTHTRTVRPRCPAPGAALRLSSVLCALQESTATGSWTSVLAIVGGVNLLAASNYYLHSTVTPIEKLVVEQQAAQAKSL